MPGLMIGALLLFFSGVLALGFLRPHLREEEDVLDSRGVRHEHGQAVYAHTHS